MPKYRTLFRQLTRTAADGLAAGAVALIVLSGAAADGLADSCAPPAELNTEIGKMASPDIVIVPGGFRPPYRSDQIEARYFMLHLVPGSAITGNWTLTLRDSSFRVLEVLGPEDFKGPHANGRWTGRLPAREIVFDLFAAPTASGVRITVDEAIIMPENVKNPRYSLQGRTATYQSLYTFDAPPDEKNRVRRLGDRVGMLIGSGPAPSGLSSWCCSGVMLSSDLFLTNWHCGAANGQTSGIWHRDRCTTTLIDLSWDEDGIGSEFHCSEILAQSEALDYALLRIGRVAGNARSTVGARPLLVARQRASTTEGIKIVHHAACKRKLVSGKCSVRNASYRSWRSDDNVTATEFTHDCDTENGSSGAPVFNAKGALIGIHHLGFGRVNSQQCDDVNKAVHIGDILGDIKQSNPAAFAEIEQSVAYSD